jgi:hypothetical protein
MSNGSKRIEREKKTVEAMIRLYCADHHDAETGLCASCTELRDYALDRLSRCPFQEAKTTCAKCPVHCCRPAQREEIRAVMRYAGPRMIFRHPILALWHLVDGRREEPLRSASARSRKEGH